MPRKRGTKSTKQATSSKSNADKEEALLGTKEQLFEEEEVERRIAGIRASRDVEIEQLVTTIRLLRSCFSTDQLQPYVLQFFEENCPNVSIVETGEGQYEVKWKDEKGKVHSDHVGGKDVHASLIPPLSTYLREQKRLKY